MGLEMQSDTHDFIQRALHPKIDIDGQNVGEPNNPSEAVTKWMDEMDYTQIANIQRDCKEAMQLWGYNFIKMPKELANADPVGKYALGSNN